ncbi:MAG: hypothetical protein AAGN64_13630 [Bacteroidota bacterium]
MRTFFFLVVIAALLALSNPTMDDFADYAGDTVAAEITREGPGWAGALGGLATETLVDRATQRADYLLASRYTLELSDDPDEAWVFLGVATRFVELQRPASLREDETSE